MSPSPSLQTDISRWRRALLPGDLLATVDARRSARDWLVDALLFAAALVVGGVGVYSIRADLGETGTAVDIVLGSLACIALWWRRSRPVAVGVVAIALSAISGMAAGAGVIALFNVALRGSLRAIVGLSLLSVAGFVIFSLLFPSGGSVTEQVLLGFLILVVAVGWGLFARVRRELVLSLRERTERLEAEQRREVELAREAERRRIAREMHDVLAHRLSLLSVHAGALEFRPDAPPEEVAEAAGVIRETAQTALQELRDVIGVLRDDGERTATEPPQPTLADIPALVEESRAAGMRVEARIDAPDGALPAALGRTAYRVVQEALTNARKHAPASAVTVSVTTGDGPQLVVEVSSRRSVGATVPTGAEQLPGAGTGLVGLAERVELAGGELTYGSDDAGDFVLRAHLPWTP
jgi:signal transduction histidine kinase